MALPELSGSLGEKNAAHLLRRATFGPTIEQIKNFSTLTVSEAMQQLFDDTATNPSPPIDPQTSASWVDPAAQRKAGSSNSVQDTLHEYFKAWHTDVMLKSSANIKERIVWFYHTHLPARWTRISSSEAVYYQNCVFRYYALGSFKELFKKICVDNAMLKYLDGATNKKNSPNENFAREMLELYSIGRQDQVAAGDYTTFTEDDVKAATKVLTGWVFDSDFTNDDADHGWPTGLLDASGDTPNHHDSSDKTFSARFDNQVISGTSTVDGAYAELDEMIEMIFAKDATAKAITRKLYRFFVYHFIDDDVETNIIAPLAETLMDNNYEVHVLLKEMLSSKFFYDHTDYNSDISDDNIGGLIKSPLDLVLGTLRFFEASTPDRETDTETFYADYLDGIMPLFDQQGLNYYEPFEVAGYPAYHQKPAYGRNWIMPSELAYRYQTGERLLQRTGYESDVTTKIDVLSWVENSPYISDKSDAAEIASVLTAYMFAVEIDSSRQDYFRDSLFLGTTTSSEWEAAWNSYESGGDSSTVREKLGSFISALMQTPEYQLQ